MLIPYLEVMTKILPTTRGVNKRVYEIGRILFRPRFVLAKGPRKIRGVVGFWIRTR